MQAGGSSFLAPLTDGVNGSGAKIFFADEAHFRADALLRGKWVLRGDAALVDSTSPRYGEKASYYSAVCLETGEVEWMELEGNSNSGTSTTFLMQLREGHAGPLNVIWDNAPAHRGEAVREYLRTPGLGLGQAGVDGKPVPGKQGSGAGQGRQLPRQAGQPEGPGQAALPYRPAIKGRKTGTPVIPQFQAHLKCTSRLGLGACLRSIFADEYRPLLRYLLSKLTIGHRNQYRLSLFAPTIVVGFDF